MYNSFNTEQRGLNFGDILHLIQIAVLLGSLGIAYQKFQTMQDSVGTHTNQLNRIEHYLSSKDPGYWKDTDQ